MRKLTFDACIRPLLLLGALVLGGAAILAAEPAAKTEERKSQPEKVYTNQDLPPEPKPDARTYTNADLPPEQPQPAPSAQPQRVFTNQDLTRMFPEPPPPQAETPPVPATDAEPSEGTDESGGDGADPGKEEGRVMPPPPAQPGVADDPLAQLEAEKRLQEVRDQLQQQAHTALAAARDKLKQLEVQLLAVSNPFSARPQLSAEELEYRRTHPESAIERRERTEALVEEARREVASLEEQLEDLR